MDWGKFTTTEWITFFLIFTVGTVALFTGYTDFTGWTTAVLVAMGELIGVRWHKKKTILQKENGTLPPLDGGKP